MSQFCEDHEEWDDCADERWIQRQRDVKVGDPATLCYPDDRYPYVVMGVTGTTISLAKVDPNELDVDNSTGGEHRGGWPIKDKSSTRQDLPATDEFYLKAHWSEKFKRWQHAGSTPIVIGYARYLRDWSL